MYIILWRPKGVNLAQWTQHNRDFYTHEQAARDDMRDFRREFPNIEYKVAQILEG